MNDSRNGEQTDRATAGFTVTQEAEANLPTTFGLFQIIGFCSTTRVALLLVAELNSLLTATRKLVPSSAAPVAG